MQKIIKNVRSTRATYNLPNKVKTEAYIISDSSVLKEMIIQYKSFIETLAYSTLSTENPPEGCAIITISDKIQVHLLLKVINISYLLYMSYYIYNYYYKYIYNTLI